ncbi:hypothetical protein [Paraburkholderia youngii]|uniref:hypothetical protein n=1 Tax=Paraburkholderia youngii TaxID=2782701 RepID=UPI001595B069|nr:hypothetical protein [Paraburkholderia youngii]
MIQMMMASIGGSTAMPSMQVQRQVLMLRKAMGIAIVASGFAVIAAGVAARAGRLSAVAPGWRRSKASGARLERSLRHFTLHCRRVLFVFPQTVICRPVRITL